VLWIAIRAAAIFSANESPICLVYILGIPILHSQRNLTMRRTLLVVPLLGAAAVAAALAVRPATSPAEGGKSETNAKATSSPQLPVAQAVLFSSGVGFFQREGEIDGNQRIDLSFPVQDINDLLKSMVLQDLGHGHVSAVSYESRDPIDKTLRSFAINLTQNPGYGQILNQARGEKVEVSLQASNNAQPGTLTGTIIGVEPKQEAVSKEKIVHVEMLNLWCAEGMRSLRMPDVLRVRFLNPVMENEVKRALEVLSLSHDTQKKAVSLVFSGEGKRPVKVSYVVENPIWKTSYRLVLTDGKPYLQGWAVVENPSDEDWNNVRMSLVSGRPISFQMDLYQPLYVPRPTVEPELFASLRPPTYTGAMEQTTNGIRTESATFRTAPTAPPGAGAQPAFKDRGAGGAAGFGMAVHARETLVREGLNDAEALGDLKASRLGLDGAAVASAASAKNLGDFFQYVIDHPVSLPRQKSAMLPIVSTDVEGARVSIYNEHTLAKHPLLGLRLKNNSGVHLMQGPITVFDKNTYAGDSRIMDLQKGEERLISYAVDLGTEVEPVAKRDSDRYTLVKIVKGIVQTTTKIRETKTYNVKNRGEQDRIVLIEHPFRPDFKLTSKEPKERARDVYRFEVDVAAGKSAKQEVIEERDLVSQIAITNLDDNTMRVIFNSNVTSKPVIEALKKSQDMKFKMGETQRELAHARQQLTDIERDQTRIRANLKDTPSSAAAYKKYLEKLDAQEGEIDKLTARIKELQEAENQQRKGYESYLANLSVE
jgi:hypothetical protein